MENLINELIQIKIGICNESSECETCPLCDLGCGISQDKDVCEIINEIQELWEG